MENGILNTVIEVNYSNFVNINQCVMLHLNFCGSVGITHSFYLLGDFMLVQDTTEYYVYLMLKNEKIFLASIITDSPHKARQLVWNKFEPEIKNKNSEAKINHLYVETVNNRIMTK